jgi:hypothetical protein
MSGCEPPVHQHSWGAYAVELGFLKNRCRCGAKRFLAGYPDPRMNAIVERLNRSWRVR